MITIHSVTAVDTDTDETQKLREREKKSNGLEKICEVFPKLTHVRSWHG